MTKKPPESSKESSKSSSPLSIEQAKHNREALVAMHKRCRKWGRTVTKGGGRLVQGSLFDFPEEKEHKSQRCRLHRMLWRRPATRRYR